MSASELLSRLEASGFELRVEDGRLRVSALRGRIDEATRDDIAAHKAELIELLAARAGAAAPVEAIARGGDLPLSFFQERLCVLQQFDPRGTDHLIEAHWRAPQGADAERVAAALERAVQRHEGLRLRFVEAQTGMVGRPGEPAPVTLHDLEGLTPLESGRRFDDEVARAVHTPIDLAREPVARFSVFRFAPGLLVIMLVAHHVALDAWSIGLLRREIDADLAGCAVAAPALQYADFAAWQRCTQAGPATAAELSWWTDTLRNAPPLSMFPPDKPAPAAAPGGHTHDFAWDASFSAALRALVREEGATVYMALLAAVAALLRAHTGQGDVVLGSPMGVRERPEFEALVGPFVNLLMIRVDLSDDPGFARLLGRVRNAVLDAHAHRHVPFEQLIERLKPARSFEHAPLFQVAVVQHNAQPRGDMALNGGGALHELTVFLHETDAGFAGSLEYRSDLYSAETIARIAAQLQQLLRGAMADRTSPLSHLPLLDAAGRARVVSDFNATETAFDATPFVRHFERVAVRQPESVAVSCEGESLDYAGLDAHANRLARRLRSAGVGPGVLVGVCMERSIALLVTLLAVHKAGGAYVPLDPGFPGARLTYMLEDSGARVLLTQADVAADIAQPDDVQRIDPDAEAVALEALDAAPLEGGAGPDDPAYVIYTSGSTGRPKGVAVPHRALSNFLQSMRREPGLAAADVLAAITTISFDIAALELFLPLTVGARVELVPRETAADGHALAECLARSGATVLQATPATWRLLLEADWQPAQPTRAFCGGEALTRELADALLPRVSELWNLYGPTETTVWSSVERVAPSPAPIGIGRPIANTRFYVLSPQGEPVPEGVPGELWIGGEGLALGYHARPELTAERFVPDRFDARPGARLYRTGDLVRWDGAGRLFHLGRLDHQVKVRGFRIELGEIEAELAGHAAVRQALVLAREASPGDARLVAYLVFQPGQDLTASDVRRHLRRRLPDYMIPSVVVAVSALPLTPNGKIDRAALPDPFAHAERAARVYVPPAAGLETTLAGVWREVLGFAAADAVGAEDNFFELGGHSLLSFKVVTAVERRTGWRMDPRLLFFQTLRQVASHGAQAGARA